MDDNSLDTPYKAPWYEYHWAAIFWSVVILALLLLCSPAFSQVTYTYQGQPICCSEGAGEDNGITLSITLSARLGANLVKAIVVPLSQSSPDLSSNQQAASYLFSTDSQGNIIGWTVIISDGSSLMTLSSVNGDTEIDSFDYLGCPQFGCSTSVPIGANGIIGYWHSVGIGAWTSPPPVQSMGIDCISNTLIAPQLAAHFILSKTSSGSSPICQYPKAVSASWYMKVTSDNGKTWSWQSLAELGL